MRVCVGVFVLGGGFLSCCLKYNSIKYNTIVGIHSTVVERGTAMWVDAGSNPAQTEVALAVVRS